MAQLFGVITVKDEQTYNAMMCSDSDQSDFATIHWWLEDVQGQAMYCNLVPLDDSSFSIKPKIFYKADNNNGLYAPTLTHEELSKLAKFSGNLKRTDDGGYIGSWEITSEESGKIFFFGANPVMKDINLEPVICNTWQDFKNWADDLRINQPDCAFRGQGKNTWMLITSLARAGRTRLERYYDETMWLFKKHAEVAMDRDFDLTNSNEYSTLLGLAQHHGLPTPLLDITESPYVAAYFAFADAVENQRPAQDYVRVYALSGDYLSSQTSPSIAIAGVKPYVQTLSVSPRHNPRLYAQQGKFLATNIVDLENFLLLISKNIKRDILFAADIPNHCAFDALQDLKYMGLTAGSLFPGLDGVSSMIKQMMIVNDKKHQLKLLSKDTSQPADQAKGAAPDNLDS